MKTIKNLPLFLIILMGFCFIQCDESKEMVDKVKNVTTDVKNISSVPHLPKQTFIDWVTTWKADGLNYSQDTLVEFFTMDDGDLIAILNETGVDSARFYLGLDDTVSPRQPHLMVVGVDSLGNDLLDYSKGQYAYDMTKPCPAICNGGYGYPKNKKK